MTGDGPDNRDTVADAAQQLRAGRQLLAFAAAGRRATALPPDELASLHAELNLFIRWASRRVPAGLSGALGCDDRTLAGAALKFVREVCFAAGNTHYQLFGLTPESLEPGVLRRRYRMLMRLTHPDIGTIGIPGDAAGWVNQAYEVLALRHKRQRYDEQLARERLLEPAPVRAAVVPDQPVGKASRAGKAHHAATPYPASRTQLSWASRLDARWVGVNARFPNLVRLGLMLALVALTVPLWIWLSHDTNDDVIVTRAEKTPVADDVRVAAASPPQPLPQATPPASKKEQETAAPGPHPAGSNGREPGNDAAPDRAAAQRQAAPTAELAIPVAAASSPGVGRAAGLKSGEEHAASAAAHPATPPPEPAPTARPAVSAPPIAAVMPARPEPADAQSRDIRLPHATDNLVARAHAVVADPVHEPAVQQTPPRSTVAAATAGGDEAVHTEPVQPQAHAAVVHKLGTDTSAKGDLPAVVARAANERTAASPDLPGRQAAAIEHPPARAPSTDPRGSAPQKVAWPVDGAASRRYLEDIVATIPIPARAARLNHYLMGMQVKGNLLQPVLALYGELDALTVSHSQWRQQVMVGQARIHALVHVQGRDARGRAASRTYRLSASFQGAQSGTMLERLTLDRVD